jgi:LmbE family N-acetylglucosaminyl deacetylase
VANMRVLGVWAVLVLGLGSAGAQSLPDDRGAAGLWLALQRLQTDARVVYLVAHPDDEDAGLLTWLARGVGADITLLSITRGEAGANLITSDSFDALGALRTLEHLRSAQAYGVKLRYTRFADYGYSKDVAEAWRKWPQEQLLRDVVWHIRQLRPHVLMSRFHGSPRDGHGQHTASGELAQLAFDAAADPNRFPDLGLPAWEVSKLYLNNYSEKDPWTVRIDTGKHFPLMGRSYAQIGREGYRWHRSQAMGALAARPGPVYSYHKLAASRVGTPEKEESFFDRLPVSTPTPVPFDAVHPQRSASTLAKLLREERHESRKSRLRDALNRALGLELEALVLPAEMPTGMAALYRPWSTVQVATPGQSFGLECRWHNPMGVAMEGSRIDFDAEPGWRFELQDERAGLYQVRVPDHERYGTVFWERDSIQQTQYRIASDDLMTRVLPPAPFVVRGCYRYEGAESCVEAEPETSSIDALGLQVRRKLVVGPALSVAFSSPMGVAPVGRSDAYRFEVVVQNMGDGAREGVLRVEAPQGVTVSPASHRFQFAREGEQARFEFTAQLPQRRGDYPLLAVAQSEGREYRSGFDRISFAGLDAAYLGLEARHVARAVDVQVASGLRAGYVMGSGDDVPHTLRQLNVAVDLLSASDIAAADLSRYPVILLGIRAYAVRPELKVHNSRLLDYVRNGGVLIVQYNTQEYDGNFGPYFYSMTARAEEVSEEDSPVRILAPQHPVFHTPNGITPEDFEGWVEQRGSKFFSTWDARWTPLLETQDTGQAPQRGGWLEARYGKGLYVYCAYAWYRQLPFGVPGALRLFGNLVSLGDAGAPWRKQ